MQKTINKYLSRISITTYKKIVAVFALICVYLLANVIYATIEYRKLWYKWQLSGNEDIATTSQQRNDTTNTKIHGDTIEISICEINKSLLNSPEINKILITPMFMAADIVIPGIRIKVNERELKYLKEHRTTSLKGGLCAVGAWAGIIGRSKDGYYNNQADALRHAFWAACVAAFTSPSEAQEMLDNHENGGSDPMDAYNNKKGVEIGIAFKKDNPGGVGIEKIREIWDAVEIAFDKGELYCSRCTPPIIPGTQQPQPNPQTAPQSPPTSPQPRERHPDNHPDPVDRNHGDRGNTDLNRESRSGTPTRDGMPDRLDPVPRGGNRGGGGDRLPPGHGPLGFTGGTYATPNVFVIGLLSFIAGIIGIFIIGRIGRKP